MDSPRPSAIGLILLLGHSLLTSCGQGQPADTGGDAQLPPAPAQSAYIQEPNVGTCAPGLLTKAWSERALAELNRARRLSGLTEVIYDPSLEAAVNECALLTAAHGVANPSPDPADACVTARGTTGCQNTNLSTFKLAVQNAPPERASSVLFSPERVIQSWLVDDTEDGSIGHRRWLLDPFLSRTAFSVQHTTSTDADRLVVLQAAAMWVTTAAPQPATAPEDGLIGYPMGDYPAELFDTSSFLSFSYLVDKSGYEANAQVSYNTAEVQVRGPEGPLMVLETRSSQVANGLPNSLQWLVVGLESSVTYEVTITGIRIAGEARDVAYEFRLVP